ncbi:MAG: putative DNA binding domain-containing protein [Thermoplasmata archaeon]
MKQEKFIKLLREGGSQKLEFKSKVTKNIGEEICAFGNSDGGYIFVGISDDEGLIGCDLKPSKERISQSSKHPRRDDHRNKPKICTNLNK